jgi:predicted Zn-dependent protease
VLKEYAVYNNPKVQAYVNDLGQRLARESHRQNLAWHFTVLDSPEINAFALPGGYVYVTRGIMAYLESEADLAGVIGHEIGHVTARHGAQRATRQQTAGIGVLAASLLGIVLESQGLRGAGDLISQGSQGLAAGYIASYGRDQELQADKLGAEYLSRLHYDPRNMVDVISVLKNQERFAEDAARAEGRQVPSRGGWLASHPSNDQRLHDITQIADSYQGKYNDEGRARYMAIVNGLPFGESAAQGLTRGRNFYHEELGITLSAPEGWKIQNGADALTLINGAGDAGLIVKLLPATAGATHEDVIRKLFNPQQGRLERRSLNGFQATHFVGSQRNQQGQVQNIEATVVSGPGNRPYVMLYAARDGNALQRARGQMQQAEASFRAMSAAERSAVHPWVLRTVPYPRGGFAELAKRSPLTGMAEQHLRLINGFYSGGEPKPGQLVKVVE